MEYHKGNQWAMDMWRLNMGMIQDITTIYADAHVEVYTAYLKKIMEQTVQWEWMERKRKAQALYEQSTQMMLPFFGIQNRSN